MLRFLVIGATAGERVKNRLGGGFGAGEKCVSIEFLEVRRNS